MSDIKEKATNEQTKNQPHRYRQQHGGYQKDWRARERMKRVKWVKYVVADGDEFKW